MFSKAAAYVEIDHLNVQQAAEKWLKEFDPNLKRWVPLECQPLKINSGR